MESLRIRLLGEPAIVDGLGARSVSPRRAFELLVLVVVAPGRRLDRIEAAGTLWPRYQRNKQMAQLRFTLSKLRSELARLGFVDILDASKTEIRLVGPVTTDVDALLEGGLPEFPVSDYLQLPLAGWRSDVAHPIRIRIGTALGERVYLEAAKLAATDPLAAVDLTRRFLRLHPFNTKVVGLQMSLFDSIGDQAGAEHTREDFEQAWLDEYGDHNVPSLEAVSVGHAQAEAAPAQRPGRTWWGALTAVPVLVGLAWTIGTNRRWPMPELGALQVYHIAGLDYKLREISVPEGYRLLSLRRTAAGTFLMTMRKGEGEPRQIRLSDGKFELVDNPAGCQLNDELDHRRLYRCSDRPESSYGLLVEGRRRHRFAPKGDLPHGGPVTFLKDGSAVVVRHCNHGEGCHVETALYKDNEERPLLSDVKPQTSGLMFSYRGEHFGRYSLGKSSRWKTTCFRMDERGVVERLRDETLAAIGSKGEQVYMVESELEQHGQIQIVPTGRFRLVTPSGRESILSNADTELFREVRQVGDLLFLDRGGVRYWTVADFEGNPVKALEPLASRCANVIPGFDAGTAIVEFRSTGKGDGQQSALVTVEERQPG